MKIMLGPQASSWLLLAVCALCLSWPTSTQAVVDTSAPDLSIFKLRKVNVREVAEQRASAPFKSLADGAEHMRELLFVSDPEVRCVSYSYLFRLIELQRLPELPVRQELAEALAILVLPDRRTFWRLFTRDLHQNSRRFVEAAKELAPVDGHLAEGPNSQATWFDLMQCMRIFMPNQEPVKQYVADHTLAARVSRLAEFYALPVPQDQASTKHVGGLVEKLHSGQGFLDQEANKRAMELLQKYDLDGELEKARREMSSEEREVQQDSQFANTTPTPTMSPKAKAKSKKEPATAPEPDSIELLEPAGPTRYNKGSTFTFGPQRLGLMRFFKLRLEGANQETRPYERAPKISMQLAYDFDTHFGELEHAQLNLDHPNDVEASQFLHDASVKLLVGRVRRAIAHYELIVNSIADMKRQEAKLESVEHFGKALAKLENLLEAMDESFDVDDVRRMAAVWRSKHNSYASLGRFIDSDSW